MKVVRTVADMRAARVEHTGFVPTMGALHAGHVSLLDAARGENDHVVMSLFVNEAQFSSAADFERYPRDEQRDLDLAERAGVDIVFAPAAEELYPPNFRTWVEPDEHGLEAAFRPGHFRAVATVCTKLFNIVRPRLAYFGQKDAQQVEVVRRVIRDLDLDVELRVLPTVRDADGLALSSRNALLTPEQRDRALALPARAADARPGAGARPARRRRRRLRRGRRLRTESPRGRDPRGLRPPDRQRPVGRRTRMSAPPAGKLPLPELAEMKRRGDKIAMVTAYDAPGARFAEDAGVDLILVGDTAAMVVLGHEGTTVPVTMDEMIFLTKTVSRARVPADRRRRHAVRLVPGVGRGRAAERDPLRQGGARGRRQARGRRSVRLARARDRRRRDPGDGRTSG